MEYLNRKCRAQYDVVVVGGGMSGICAAIASARQGAKTALVQGRAMLGGNASSEIRMHICGANCQMAKPDVNEGGILLELLLENKRLNPRYNFNLWDAILLDKVQAEPGLTLYLNTVMHEVHTEGSRITEIVCYRSTTEQTFTFAADIFLDCTGHGTLGYFAGAKCRMGSEGRAEFDEAHAPETPTDALMGQQLFFSRPSTAASLSPIVVPTGPSASPRSSSSTASTTALVGTLSNDGLTADKGKGGLPELYCVDYGYWWLELGGDSGDIIGNAEEIRDELMRSLWGIWDHIKNGGDHGAENYDLQWCGIIPGTRDSRRLVGDYLLNENDILANRVFDDAVAYGGWPMDVHTPGGLHDTDFAPRPMSSTLTVSTPYRGGATILPTSTTSSWPGATSARQDGHVQHPRHGDLRGRRTGSGHGGGHVRRSQMHASGVGRRDRSAPAEPAARRLLHSRPAQH